MVATTIGNFIVLQSQRGSVELKKVDNSTIVHSTTTERAAQHVLSNYSIIII
jgi:hypothetical protein